VWSALDSFKYGSKAKSSTRSYSTGLICQITSNNVFHLRKKKTDTYNFSQQHRSVLKCINGSQLFLSDGPLNTNFHCPTAVQILDVYTTADVEKMSVFTSKQTASILSTSCICFHERTSINNISCCHTRSRHASEWWQYMCDQNIDIRNQTRGSLFIWSQLLMQQALQQSHQ